MNPGASLIRRIATNCRQRFAWRRGKGGVMLLVAWACFSVEAKAATAASPPTPPELTNAASVRELTLDRASLRLPVRLSGVVTFAFTGRSFFVRDSSAGIYVGNGAEGQATVGDIVEVEGVSGPGEYAPLVEPTTIRIVGRTNLPAARHVSFEDLMTGREDSQWVEVSGLVRAVQSPATNQITLDLATGGGRLTVFMFGESAAGLQNLVDSQVRVRGVCGSWFNKLRQLFGVRLMVPGLEQITVEEPAADYNLATQAIGDLLRFAPNASSGHRVKVAATVVLQQPGRALFVEDGRHGLFVQSLQRDLLQPGDQVEIIGFPDKGEYTPLLQDAVWRKIGSGPEPAPAPVQPDVALAGLHDCRLVSIEGRLLDLARNDRETVLVLQADQQVFSAHLESTETDIGLAHLQIHSRLRLTGVCRIEVGDEWRAGPDWRAKSFRILLRHPGDVEILALPPWWTLPRLLWAVGILAAVVLISLSWVTLLRRKVGQQTNIIRQQLELEARLKERYQDLFESANDMVYTHNLDGRMTSINMAGERMLGRDRSSITGRFLADFVVEEQRAAVQQWLADIIDGAAPVTVEWEFVTTADRLRLEISTRLIEREGREVEVEGIARDVTERHRLEKEILEVSTREQRRIGHDLHDGVCQELAGIACLSEILADKLQEQHRPEAADARKITELVNRTNKQTRGVARGLFPVRLEENGLVSAIEELCANAGAFFKTRFEFRCDETIAVRDLAVAHHLYFIAQEAILNAAKHGRARLIEVGLTTENGRGFLLTVTDDGGGFAKPPGESRGMGIRIMKYRARMIGAELQVRPRPKGGVEVLCHINALPQESAAREMPAETAS